MLCMLVFSVSFQTLKNKKQSICEGKIQKVASLLSAEVLPAYLMATCSYKGMNLI